MPRHRSILKPAGFALFIALLALMSGSANATDIFTAPSTDWTIQNILNPLFGQGLTFADSPLGPLVSIFNAAVLFVGGLLATYTIIAGTMATAHEGEMLGKRWSSMWAPIRTAIGAVAILPTLNGFCLAQALMLWLISQGVGLADTIWTKYLENFQQHAVYHSVLLDAKLRTTFESMVLSNVCFESGVSDYAQANAEQKAQLDALEGSSVPNSVGATWFKNVDGTGAGSAGYNYGNTDVSGGPSTSACGSVTLKLTGSPAVTAPTSGNLAAQSLVDMPIVTASIEQAHLAGIQAMQAAANAFSKQIVANGNSVAPSPVVTNAAINAGVQAYSSAVSAVAQTAFNNAVNSNMVQAMAQDGWADAGASYMRLMQAQADVNAAVGNLPMSVDGTTAGTSHFLTLFDTSGRTDNDVALARSALKAADEQNLGKITDGSTDGFSKLINAVSGKSWFGANSFDPQEDPIMTASALGQGMIETAEGMGVVGAGIMMAGAVPVVGQAVVAGAGLFGPFYSGLMFALIGPGAALAYGLPMIPLIMMLGVVIGWICMVIEAMIAAPLAAVMLLNPHQEAIGGLEKALGLTLSVTLRPALSVLGLCASMMVMSKVGPLVNSWFGFAFSSTPGGFLSFIKMFAGAFIYAGLAVFATKHVFSLIHRVPDELLNWIGATHHGDAMGKAATDAHSSTGAAVAAGVGAAVAVTGKGLGGSLNRGGGKGKGKGGDEGGAGDSGPRERGPNIPNDRTPTSNGSGRDAKDVTGSGGSGMLSEARKVASAGNTPAAGASTGNAAPKADAPAAAAASSATPSAEPAAEAKPEATGGMSDSLRAVRDRLVEPQERPDEPDGTPPRETDNT
ncbi:DotA/TraY family protein [Paraburkholderia dilworthii]|uniref:DotA/TraY family protein n=1 Tax=Paraburkholderia dilworthii TaxID=948106 RepID=A0ABW9D7J0_9BURK